MLDAIATEEREKYEEMWSAPEYRAIMPGMDNVQRFMDVMKPKAGESIIDIGCGTGQAGLALERHGLNVWWLDLTNAALDVMVPRSRFIDAPLWSQWRGKGSATVGWDYGFCVDVLEHIPPEFVMLSLSRILSACCRVWLQISTEPDNCGQLIGKQLHLTVRPFNWWLLHLDACGAIEEARDLCDSALFVVRR